MRKGYDITKVDFYTICEISKDLAAVRETYVERGYQVPLNSLLLVRKMYEKQFAKEDRIASGLTREQYEEVDDGLKGTYISDGVADRFEALILLSQMKILRTCMTSFENRQTVQFAFNGAMPDTSAKELFNLSLSTNEYLNISRTDALRFPESLYGTIPQRTEYEIYPEGESIVAKGMSNYKGEVEDCVITEPAISPYAQSILFSDDKAQ